MQFVNTYLGLTESATAYERRSETADEEDNVLAGLGHRRRVPVYDRRRNWRTRGN